MVEDTKLSTIKPRVKVTIQHWRDGKLLFQYEGGDVIGSAGRDLLAYRAGTADAGRVRYIRASAIGTGQASPYNTGLTKLGSVVYHGTAPFAKGAATGSFTFNRSFAIGSSYAIRESGLFVGTRKDALLRGTMYCRGTFPVRNVIAGDTITLNYRGGFVSG